MWHLWIASVLAAEHRVGGSAVFDYSSGLVTGIDRIGTHGGVGYALLGERQGLFVDVRYQCFTWGGLWERFPAVNLGWTMRWSPDSAESGLSGYHSLGVMALLPGTMDTALAPLIPAVTAEAGAEWGRDRWWLRAGAQGFFTFPALAAGVGPRVAAGVRF